MNKELNEFGVMILERTLKTKGVGISTYNRNLWNRILAHKWIYLLLLPGLLYFLIFRIGPMWGLLIAFKEYNAYVGFWASDWVGLQHFRELFGSTNFYIMLRNTFVINLLSLIFFFPLPIVLSIMLNEVRHDLFKRVNQSIVYLPHFLSWVVVASLTAFMLSTDIGVLNKLIHSLGFERISFLSNANYFWGIITVQNIWKELGWGTIIFLAAIAGVDPSRYEVSSH